MSKKAAKDYNFKNFRATDINNKKKYRDCKRLYKRNASKMPKKWTGYYYWRLLERQDTFSSTKFQMN